MIGIILSTVLDYTVPQWSAINCDSVVYIPAQVWMTEVWWSPRYSYKFSKLYEKSVIEREGQNDTISVPSDTSGTVYLIHTDYSGNRSCPSNYVTVNIPTVSVDYHECKLLTSVVYDIQGRKVAIYYIREKKTIPKLASGIYFTKKGKLVIWE